MRLHPAICRVAGLVDALSRPRPVDRRGAVQRFRWAGAGRRRRNLRNRRTPIWRELPDHRQGGSQWRRLPSVLPVGLGPAPARPAALELPQVSDRPRRRDRSELPLRDRADRRPGDRGDREGAFAGGDELRRTDRRLNLSNLDWRGRQLYAGCNTRLTLILPAFFSIWARS